MNSITLNPQDAPRANQAECFVTKGSQRYNMISAKSFEAKANIETGEVNSLGRVVKGHKAIRIDGTFTMTVYKCSPLFSDMVTEFRKTGVMPTFDIQVTNSDEATSIGKDTKIYTGCTLDGDVLLSMFDADGDFITQEVSGFYNDVESAEDYHNPQGM